MDNMAGPHGPPLTLTRTIGPKLEQSAARPTTSPNRLLWLFCPSWTIRFMTSATTYWIILLTSHNLFRLGHIAILVPPD
ncbi:hypothetical protein IGI04_040000 [Brassica rapa subsp. trilocularis]|uniref:Uncharacterized protein n=1 Tax=Brassica rapa subsp. trilocularis TaxID=1813537 RepID=A0ABQ7KQ54_BRACM|nr:hypothetical protein IGI04_040000 [Brassica rapa subsp. trilocularis]